MLYIDHHTVEDFFDTDQINKTATAMRRIGQDLSANGTGPNNTYARRRGAARSVASRGDVGHRAACHDPVFPASLSGRARATVGPTSRQGGHCRTTCGHVRGVAQ